jgi:hypothetical protein
MFSVLASIIFCKKSKLKILLSSSGVLACSDHSYFIFIIHFIFFFNLDFLQKIILARTENIELDCCQTNGRMDGWMNVDSR